MKQTQFTLTDNDLRALKETIEVLSRADDALFHARHDPTNLISGPMFTYLMTIGDAVINIRMDLEVENLLAQVGSSPSGQAGQAEAPGVE